jgi:hypothetical protein
MMTSKNITLFFLAIGVILGWNVFLIQRDNALYDAHYHRQAVENIKRSPNTEIR